MRLPYSFAPYDWSMYFALRDELKAYLEHAADKFNLRPHIRFETEVESADWGLPYHRGKFQRS